MKIGLDIHGVIDAIPDFFSVITKLLVDNGHEVHIITGQENGPKLLASLKKLNVSYTHLFSITSYCKEKGEKITYEDSNNPWIDEKAWNRAKGEYCERVGIDIHIDDTEEYCKHFSTPFLHFRK